MSNTLKKIFREKRQRKISVVSFILGIDFKRVSIYNKCVAKKKGDGILSPAHGRPPSKDPKEHQKRIRMSDEDVRILEYCSKATGRTQSDIIREGIRAVYAKLKK